MKVYLKIFIGKIIDNSPGYDDRIFMEVEMCLLEKFPELQV